MEFDTECLTIKAKKVVEKHMIKMFQELSKLKECELHSDSTTGKLNFDKGFLEDLNDFAYDLLVKYSQ